MKRCFPQMLILVLIAAMLLTGCGTTTGNTEPTPTETDPIPTEPEVTFTVAIPSEAVCDSPVQAKVDGDITGDIQYQWYLDGEVLPGAVKDTLHIPTTAAGKALTVAATVDGKSVKSEEITVKETTVTDVRTMAGLYYDVKMIGRCSIIDTQVTVDFSAGGFEMNLRSNGGDFVLEYKTQYNCYFAIYLDGELYDRVLCRIPDSTITVPLTEGEHTLKFLKETEIPTDGAACYLRSVTFSGEVLPRPADKALFIEFVGDSISCGDGSLGVYTAGQAWNLEDHSGTHSYAFYTAEALDADYSIFARGGIGLLKPAGAFTTDEMYRYTNRYRDKDELYVFPRTPDIIVLELGANDDKSQLDEYTNKLRLMIDIIREIHGKDAKIVWAAKNLDQFGCMKNIISERSDTDPNLYAMRYEYGGSGSAALATQTSGHPSAEEQKGFADALVAFLKENNLA